MTLNGDAAYPVPAGAVGLNVTGNMFAATTTDLSTNNDFIWSPNSTTSHSYTTTVNNFDFTNGFGLLGLPGTSMTTEYFTSPSN